MNKNVLRLIVLLLTIGWIVFSSCLEIDTVEQPANVAPNDTLNVTIEIHSEDTDPNPHAVFFTVLIPNDWDVIGLNYDSEKFGRGNFNRSQYWADSCEKVYPSGPDDKWVGYLSDRSFLADEDYIPATLTCQIEVGLQDGTYSIGYTLGEDALGYDTSWGDVYDYSFDHVVQVISRIRVPEDYPTIQQGIDAASPGWIVRVAAGEYDEDVVFHPNVLLVGAGADSSFIRGTGTSAVVTAVDGVTMQGFTIQNAPQDKPLLTCQNTDSITIKDCRFELNNSNIGITIDSSNVVRIEYNQFHSNGEQNSGASINRSVATLAHNQFYGCEKAVIGNFSQVDMFRNLMTSADSVAIQIQNALQSRIFNNTIAYNLNGIRASKSQVSIFNNIVSDNQGFGIKTNPQSEMSYNDVWNNFAGNYINCNPGEGSLSVDPNFMGGDPFDFQISQNSPCIDAGDPDSKFDPDGTRADMGAYYFNQPGIPSSIRKIYLVHFTHLDIGFTDPQDVVAHQYKGIIDQAISYADNISTFKYTIESAWQLEQWLERSTPSEIDHLKQLVNADKIHLGAGYATMHTANLGTEEMCRFLYPSEHYKQQFGFNTNTIFQNDVPGYAWSLPSVLADAGVKYMATGINITFGGGPDLPIVHNPFYWQGPDGNKVLIWISYGAYIEYHSTYQMGHINTFYEALSKELAKLEEAGYPYDAIMIMVGKIENTNPTTLATGMASLWNQTYANPKLIVSSPDGFFKHLKEKYGNQFETYSGDWSGGWDHISLNVPNSMSMNRVTHNRVTSLEKVSVINQVVGNSDYPAVMISGIYKNMLQFDEHSGGGAPWPGLMTYEETQRQSEIAYHYAKDAFDSTNYLLDVGLSALSENIQTEQEGIMVFNPLSYQRDDVVKTDLSDYWNCQLFELVDAETDSAIDFQILEDTGEILFTAEDVPSVGYKNYYLNPLGPDKNESSGALEAAEKPLSEESRASKNVLNAGTVENQYYRISVDPGDGQILSIYDKRFQKELVNSSTPYKFNGCIKANGAEAAGGAFHDVTLGSAEIDSSIRGDIAQCLVIRCFGSPVVKTEIWLYQDFPRFEIVNTIDRDLMDWVPQQTNFEYYAYTFPFDLPNFDVYLESANGFINPKTDHLPGAPRGYFAIQHGGCMTDGSYSILWSSPGSFVVEFERFHGVNREFSPVNATLISRFIKKEDEGRFENGSIGPIIPEPGASNLIRMSYAFTTDYDGFNPVTSMRFNQSFCNPLFSDYLETNPNGTLPNSGASFFRLDQDNILLINAKQPDWGSGHVLRLQEIAGVSTSTIVGSEIFRFSDATITNGLEKDVSAASVTEDGISLTFSPHEIKTVRAYLSSTAISTDKRNELVVDYKLYQNYPNPFNPATSIKYQIPENTHVNISIFNLRGQLVKQLVDEPKGKGNYLVHWDGTDAFENQVSSGVYIYRLQTEYFNSHRKLLMIK